MRKSFIANFGTPLALSAVQASKRLAGTTGVAALLYLRSLRVKLTNVVGPPATLTWFLSRTSATAERVTLDVASSVVVDTTDPTQAVVIYNFDDFPVYADDLHFFGTLDAGTADAEPELIFTSGS